MTDQKMKRNQTEDASAAEQAAAGVVERAKAMGLPSLTVIPKEVERSVLEIIPEEAARKYRMVPFRKEGGVLHVAMTDPQDFEALNVLRFLAEKERLGIEVYLASQDMFDEIAKHYTGTDAALKDAIKSLKKEDELTNVKSVSKKGMDAEVFQDAPIAKLVEVIVKHAIENRASDIHIEPQEPDLKAASLAEAVSAADLVVLAVPVGALTWAASLAAAWKLLPGVVERVAEAER